MNEKTIFKKIIDREIPADIIYEDDRCLAFKDVDPKAPTHILLIPKKEIRSLATMDDEDQPLLGHMCMVLKKIADDIFRTHEKVIEFMKPGVTLGEIQDLGRNEMKKAGYITRKGALPSNDEVLGGVTIHGLGLGPMHDPPHVEDLDLKLESGMTGSSNPAIRTRA